jgi:hypothetical protein
MWETSNEYRIFVEKLKEKRPIRRPRRRWEDNIKIDQNNLAQDSD